jgi:ubiquinone/menaquinone biosynthesis C-methylase UbiE
VGTMERIPEGLELMLDVEQAHVYGAADLSRVNGTLPEALREHFPEFSEGRVLDLGCGTGDMTMRVASAYPHTKVLGIDGAPAMLEIARRHVVDCGLEERIELTEGHLPDVCLESRSFDAVFANSLLHHVAEPVALWRTMNLCGRAGAPLLVVDLIRPDSFEVAEGLVEAYAGRGHPRVKQEFLHSLCAAYTVEEVRQQLSRAGMAWIQVGAANELQWKAWGLCR